MSIIITNVKQCKERMSPEGWELFVEDMKNETGCEPFNPETELDETEIALNRLEVIRYEYSSRPKSLEAPYRYDATNNTVEQLDDNGDVISKHTPCPSEKWAWEQLSN